MSIHQPSKVLVGAEQGLSQDAFVLPFFLNPDLTFC